MKSHTKKLVINTQKRVDFVNITHEVELAVKESGVMDGLVLVNPMHITASVYINDAESGLIQDYKEWLEELVPKNKNYHHHQTGEDNGWAHLMRTIMGREVTVAITNGKLDFGTWEQIYYAEFDGQRDKRIMIKILGE
ncbi:YjbQ family protein [Candidatus Woesearchaeota archaeon]|jgi:secondary thiamine-phosphate synthase enzyme|nr:YjbQ family protein [Candidatus Woesearchaeota archaeon]